MTKERIAIGKISGAHGIKGLVKIMLFDFDPALLDMPTYTDETSEETLSISLKNKNGKHYLASVEGVSDRNQSEALKGTQLYIDRDQVPENMNVQFEMIGFTALNEQGDEVGKVIAFENFGASDLLEIKPKVGDSFYVPFDDQFIPETNLDAQTITVQNIDEFQT